MNFVDLIVPEGTTVRITKDVRKDGVATGKTGKLIGYEESGAWMLFNADGSPEIESRDLPDDYATWRPTKEKFPKIKCGMKARNPLFKLDDGSEINGGQCYWEPKNPIRRFIVMQIGKILFRLSGYKNSKKTK